MSFRNRCMISSSYEFQAHQQCSQRRCCFSQNAQLWFEVLPDAPRFVAGAPRCSAMERDTSSGRREACDSPSEGTRFCQSCQSCPEHPGVSDGNWGCCWCSSKEMQALGRLIVPVLPVTLVNNFVSLMIPVTEVLNCITNIVYVHLIASVRNRSW
jgi:hypothetical protein